jgi:hypothetical protein
MLSIDATYAALDRATLDRGLDKVAKDALILTRTLLEQRRTLAAANELDFAVAWLTGKPKTSRALAELLPLLAGLYDRLGDPDRARRAALAGQAHAWRVDEHVERRAS